MDSNDANVSSMNTNRAASRKARIYVFREFLGRTYPGVLRSGGTILDVAGGKGDLSWLLCNLDSVNSVVVDPRITKNHIVKSVRYLRDHPVEATERSFPGMPTYQPLAKLLPQLSGRETFASPRNMRIPVDEELVRAIREYKRTNAFDSWARFWREATQKGEEATPLGYREERASESQPGQQLTGAEEALGTILSAALVVGFHPDQATDACMSLARQLGVPFCVVPCCVFPSQFEHRRLADGSKVKRYSELIQFLKEQDGSILTDTLEFPFTETAKNLALYTLGAGEES